MTLYPTQESTLDSPLISRGEAGARTCASAGVAQLVEHRFCKPEVRGSSPLASSVSFRGAGAPLVAGSEFPLLTPTRRRKIRRSLVAHGGFPRLVTPRPLASRASVCGQDTGEVVGGGWLLRNFACGDSFSTGEVAAKASHSATNSAAQATCPQDARVRRRASGQTNSAKHFSKTQQSWQNPKNQAVFGGRSRNSLPATRGFLAKDPRKIQVGCPSGQREQAVNLPAYAYVGSNPTPTTNTEPSGVTAGVAQLVERQPSKLNVASSNLVSRSEASRPLTESRESKVPCLRQGVDDNSARSVVLTTNLVSRSRLSSFGAPRGVSARRAALRPSGLAMRQNAHIAQLVERVLGKDEVTSSNLVVGSHPCSGRPQVHLLPRVSGKESGNPRSTK